jgi:hypothetical protein
MNLSQLITELKAKEQFTKFMQENPDAYLTAVFVVLDDSGKDIYQLDFFIASKQKIAIATYPFEEIIIQPDEIKESGRLDINIVVDINQLRAKVDEIKSMENLEKVRVTKIIGILKEDIWNLTCLSSTLDIIKISLDKSGEVIKCQKAGLLDFVVKK